MTWICAESIISRATCSAICRRKSGCGKDYPLRAVRAMTDGILREMSPLFDNMYARRGRPSIPPEKLLRAQLLQMLY